MSQQFCLKWNNHMNNMMDVFKNLLSTEAMVDVTLACDGLSLKAHKIVLSACSPFFQSLFLENPCKHPIVILKDMKYTELKAIIEFMYHGEVNVAQDQLSALMKTAETLRVKGLAEVTNEKQSNSSENESSSHRSVPRTDTPPPSKRRRGRTRKRSISDQSDDEVSEPKIKQPDSDIEELDDVDASSQYSSVPSSVPIQTVSSHSTNSFHKQSHQEQPVDQGAEESFVQEEKFGVEPSKLLEQTLTTDDLPRRSGRSSVQSNMSNMEMQRRPRSSADHSTSLVPTSMPSDALVVANQQPESPPDIKPELLELDPPMSPVAGPSHSTDENSMMMYMDQSSMSGLPGPSGYQDNSALVSTDSQPQVFEDKVFKYLEKMNKQIQEIRKTVGTDIAPPALPEKCPHFPLDTPEELKSLDAYLEDKTFFAEVCNYFGKVGGSEVKTTIRNILSALVTNRLSLQYSWKGTGGKKMAFCELRRVRDLISASVWARPSFKNASTYEIELTIKKWFMHAKDRDGGRIKRAIRQENKRMEDLVLNTVLSIKREKP